MPKSKRRLNLVVSDSDTGSLDSEVDRLQDELDARDAELDAKDDEIGALRLALMRALEEMHKMGQSADS